ncbi:hypothetical protein KBC99_01495 [Candidatus Saccharibacteria bacterium]|nr:hypothetical protein [Candidatus Saccharibacteria bacterium]
MNQPDTILILSSSFGQGHMATARALASAAEAHPELNFEVKIIDFSQEVNRLFNSSSKKIYDINTKHIPTLQKLIYVSTDKSKIPIQLLNLFNYPFRKNHLKHLLRQANPKIIISNYPIWQYLGFQISKQTFPDVDFATLITDSISVHSSWITPDSDYYIVPNEPTASSLHTLGVDNAKIYTLGYPVHNLFAQKESPTSIRSQLGLPTNQQIIVFSAAALRASYVLKVCRAIHDRYPESYIVVVAGRDQALYEDLLDVEFFTLPTSRLVGWSTDWPNYIRAASIVITKAGGSTVMECIAASKPMIINKIIPGQEEGNAELVSRLQLGIIAIKPTEILHALETLVTHYDDFIERLNTEAKPKASTDILRFLRAQLDTRK